MKNYRPIYWGQGQLLTPQHLQQQDLFNQSHAHYLWRLSQAFGWGIKHLRIREEALEDGSFEILNVELISPEGLLIKGGSQCHESNAVLHPRKFEDFFDVSQGSLPVYLAVTEHQIGQDNLAESSDPLADEQLAKRYSIIDKKENDLYDTEAYPTNVNYVNYYVRLYFGSEKIFKTAHKMLDVIQIAQLDPTGNEQSVKLSKQFIPPTLQLGASPVLVDIIKNIRDLLAGRAQEFEGFIRERGARASIGSSQDLLRTFMLQTLHRYIPLCQHSIESLSQHPEYLYQEMRRLVGELSVFSEEISVFGANKLEKQNDVIPPYDHNKIWDCFHDVWLKVRDLVMAMTSGPADSITLEFDGVDIYKNNLKPEFFEKPFARYYLMIDSLLKGDEVWSRLQNTGKITSKDDIELLRRSAVMGLKLEYLPVPPEELPQKNTRYTYFRIDTQSAQWQTIKDDRNISVFCDLDSEDTIIKIIRVGGDT